LRTLHSLLPWLLAGLLGAPAVLAAQSPLGAAFQVNIQPGLPRYPELAVNAAGEFVVTWILQGSPVTSLFARKFAADGTPMTGEVLIRDQVLSSAATDRVVLREDGSFVVVYVTGSDLKARFYGPEGAFERESGVSGGAPYESPFAVAGRADGGFLVTWTAPGETKSLVRIFDADGTPRAPARSLAGGEASPAVDPRGRALIASVATQVPPGASLESGFLLAQRLGPGGGLVGERILIPTLTPDPADPKVGADAAGRFVVLWGEFVPFVGEQGIFVRRFGADGAALGGRVQVSLGGRSPDLAVAPDGSFVAVWEDVAPAPTVHAAIVGRRYTRDGTAAGPRFEAGQGRFDDPKVAGDGAGNFVVVWDKPDPGVSSSKVFARVYRKD
jgi:hypothetical protein